MKWPRCLFLMSARKVVQRVNGCLEVKLLSPRSLAGSLQHINHVFMGGFHKSNRAMQLSQLLIRVCTVPGSNFDQKFWYRDRCFLMEWDWVHLVLRPLFGLLRQSQIIGDDDCGAIGEMRIDRGNRNTRRKPAPVSLCPPQITYDLNRARARAAGVESRRPTAWAMARPLDRCFLSYSCLSIFITILLLLDNNDIFCAVDSRCR
jgi:hypothetical protein